jgi:hypothetical protein
VGAVARILVEKFNPSLPGVGPHDGQGAPQGQCRSALDMREASRLRMTSAVGRRYPQDVLFTRMVFVGKDDGVFNEQRIAMLIDSCLGR